MGLRCHTSYSVKGAAAQPWPVAQGSWEPTPEIRPDSTFKASPFPPPLIVKPPLRCKREYFPSGLCFSLRKYQFRSPGRGDLQVGPREEAPEFAWRHAGLGG